MWLTYFPSVLLIVTAASRIYLRSGLFFSPLWLRENCGLPRERAGNTSHLCWKSVGFIMVVVLGGLAGLWGIRGG